MLLLAADTAAHLCSACLYDAGRSQVVARRVEDVGRRHAERLLPMIEEILAETDVAFADLDRLAVCVGPGSFTGLRVGVAAMRGLALALDVPLIAMTVFECLAHPHMEGKPVLVVLDARREEVYAQLFAADGQPSGAAAVLPPHRAADLARRDRAALVGTGAQLVASEAPDLKVLDTAGTVDIDVLAGLAAGRAPQDRPPLPLYLRAPDAKPQSGFALPRRREAS